MKLPFVIAFAALSLIASAKPMMPGHIPGDRLIANLTERIKKDPSNPEIYYLIGRAHYAVFSRAVETTFAKKGEVEVFQNGDDLPRFYSLPGNVYPWDSKTAVEDTPANRHHIRESIANLTIALLLGKKSKSDNALTHLTLACAFECGALLAPKITLSDPFVKLKTKEQWRDQAATEYLLAYQDKVATDEKVGSRPLFGLKTLVSYEAGTSFVRLKPKAKESADIKAQIEKLMKLPPPGYVTPLILDLNENKSLNDLLQPATKVSFDLDGSGRKQTYGWTKPTTAFLVWAPEHQGHITSGRQLFGNATWWMLWSNAYAAMDALDDNHDGWLTGKELKGLALWYDRNGNGKSEPGEVVPIEQTQISALNAHFDGEIEKSFVSKNGVRLKDGRQLPTYDWVTKAIG